MSNIGNNQTTFGSIDERFWSKVDKDAPFGCWEWTAFIDPKGYGTFKVGNRMVHAQRVSWELTYGMIPAGLLVCHKCDNRKCVNPHHLFLGTNDDNMKDMAKKGRARLVPMPGEKNPQSKLKEHQIKEIRVLYSTGEYTYNSLGNMYGVDFRTVSQIVRYKRWKHVK